MEKSLPEKLINFRERIENNGSGFKPNISQVAYVIIIL